jgi:predicted DCC family thiol-disulfide oxidoreductase YuxK
MTERPVTVLYDPACPVCREWRDWLGQQRTTRPMELIPAGSPLAAERFPALDHSRTRNVLTVIDERGGVYEHDAAWLVIGSLLTDWADVAAHFASPLRRPLVRIALAGVDAVRVRSKRAACGDRCGPS